MMVSFSGKIYALKKNSIYVLSNFTKNEWKWAVCDWTPGNITHMSTTKDCKFLILQNDETIKIFSGENEIKSVIKKYEEFDVEYKINQKGFKGFNKPGFKFGYNNQLEDNKICENKTENKIFVRKYDTLDNYIDYYPKEKYYIKSSTIFENIKDVEIFKGEIYAVYETDIYDKVRICYEEPFYF